MLKMAQTKTYGGGCCGLKYGGDSGMMQPRLDCPRQRLLANQVENL